MSSVVSARLELIGEKFFGIKCFAFMINFVLRYMRLNKLLE